MKRIVLLVGIIISSISLFAQQSFYRTANRYYSKTLYQQAQSGDAAAMNDIGSCYDRGAGIAQNREDAARWFRASANKGNSMGEYNVGLYHENGFIQIDENDPEVLVVINNTPLNLVAARHWYEMSAKHGFIPGKAKIAEFYYKGIGGIKDIPTALTYYKQLAEKDKNNYLIWNCVIGQIYRDQGDIDQAIIYYRKSAEMGFVQAQCDLAQCYLTKMDEKNAVYWFQKMVETDKDITNTAGRITLGSMYEYGRGGLPVSYKKAFELYSQNAGKGDARGVYEVGRMYFEGKYVKQDYIKAFEYFKKAAKSDYGKALYRMGIACYKGDHVDRNYQEAVNYFNRALNDILLIDEARGDILMKLSSCYRYELGVKKDEQKADQLLKEASKYGNADAQAILEWLSK